MSYDNVGQVRRTLENVFTYSFPNSSVIEVSMVKNNDPELKSYERQYFYFFNMIPGVTRDGVRTFDTNNKISFKQDLEKMLAISYAIRDMANGMTSKYSNGKFTMFSDPSKAGFGNNSGNKKILTISFANDQTKGPGVSIVMNYGNINVNCLLAIPMANAIADIIDFMCKKGLELEFSRDRSVSAGPMNNERRPNYHNNQNNQNYNRNNNSNYQNNYNNQSQPQQTNNNFFANIQSDEGASFAEDFRTGFGAAINGGSESGPF